MNNDLRRYMFIFNDESYMETSPARSVKEALILSAKDNGADYALLEKCFVGFKDNDFEQLFAVYNKFCYDKIVCVYEISRVLYNKDKPVEEEKPRSDIPPALDGFSSEAE